MGLYRDLHDERPGGVGIYFISHVGGHKFSANVMVYRHSSAIISETLSGSGDNGEGDVVLDANKEMEGGEAAQCIWLARVRPEDCENIVRYTVLQGKVVKPERQLRGGFDREKGLASW
jgi:(2Fe-2S) ferredoxin